MILNHVFFFAVYLPIVIIVVDLRKQCTFSHEVFGHLELLEWNNDIGK